jgi:glycosyltransferase involved in cell wall biosynthesis
MQRYAHIPARAVILSFEGPDRYSMVGGLGVRVSELAIALDNAGTDTDLIFIGEPSASHVEVRGRALTLRRWCQWISAQHPGGVYDGEWGKSNDYSASVPPFIVDEIVAPAAQRGERVLVLAEDWHVVPAVLHLDAILRERGLRDRVTIAWNANNTYGFHTIDFGALARAAHITCVSRYMKFELALAGVGALVIPNGIPERIFSEISGGDIAYMRRIIGARALLLKVGRFDPDKRWMQAVDAVANLHDAGFETQFVVRGGKEAYGHEVLGRAQSRGLTVGDMSPEGPTIEAFAGALAAAAEDVINVRTFLPDSLLFALYGAADAVLANSGKEPFGLVGLEVMAAGGIAVVGSTGEDYAMAFDNALVCDSDDPRELATYLERLRNDHELGAHIRERAVETARSYTWPHVLDVLDAKIAYMDATR